MRNQMRELGKVEAVHLTMEGHGILTLWLHIKFEGSGQGFGGIALDGYDKAKDRRIGTACGGDFILQMLMLFKVDSLEAIVGRYVYALRADEKWNSPIIGLELPEPDGGAKFMVDEWRKEWGVA